MRQELLHTIELVAGGGVAAVLTFAFILVSGRMLGPAEYADFSAALSFFYFVAVATSPLTPTTARLVTLYRLRGEDDRVRALPRAVLQRVLRWSAIAAAPILIAVIPLARIFRFQSPMTIVLALCSAILFTTVSVQRGVLQGLGRFREHVINTIVEAALRVAGAVVVLYYLPSPTSALMAYLGALVIAELLLRRLLPSGEPSSASIDWTEVKILAGPMLIAMLGVAVFQNAHVLAVKHWFAASEAGYYGAASSLASATSVLFVAVYTLSGPLLTDRHTRGETLLIPTLRLCGYFAALAAIPTLLFAFGANTVVAIVYGSAFRGAGAMLAALAGVPILTYLSLIIGQALITIGDRRFGRIYLGFAIIQVISFLFAHDTIRSIILSMYLVQGLLLFVMLLLLPRLRRRAVG